MLKFIKSTIITLGLASGMTAGALAYQHTPTTCRALVLRDLRANQEFVDSIAPQDFLTALTKGK